MLCAPQPALLKAFSYCDSEAFWQLAFMRCVRVVLREQSLHKLLQNFLVHMSLSGNMRAYSGKHDHAFNSIGSPAGRPQVDLAA